MRFFWICWILTSENFYFNAFFIIQPVSTIVYTVQNIIINIFFIAIAIKHFQNIVHVRSAIIINIIVIILECIVVLIEFLIIDRWISFCVIAIIAQIKTRLEIEILFYIVRSTESAQERLISGENVNEIRENKFCHVFDFFLSHHRAEGLT